MLIRPETPQDTDAIRALTQAAFAGAAHADGTEHAIIDALRTAGSLTLSLVAETRQGIAGHVCFSPVRIGGRDIGWFGLGPVSVAPDQQGQGIGQALVREGLALVRAMGAQGCTVLGDPGYYRRFGFANAAGLVFEGVPPEYFMQITFVGPTPAGLVTYHPAFHGAATTGDGAPA